ncbi:ABC transporter substrate-binding protein [Ammonicoccus fulvus]|uniref:ABC transporter substrate-binding protein n=1 Tax=Ammonicoccus fulvus TaxID=3138240 RepID=A0ABZ3FNZ1_9ACTN
MTTLDIRVRRRGRALRSLAAAGIAALLLSGCGQGTGTGTTTDVPPTQQPDGVAENQEGVSKNPYGGEALSRGEAKSGGEIRVGLPANVESLDPIATFNGPAFAVGLAVYDRLMKLDPSGKPVGELAESMTSDDNKTWIMKLPSDVTFHDDTPFNAQAVVAHLERLGSPESRSQSAGDIRAIQSMRAVDDTTVEFVLQTPWSGFPKVFTRWAPAYVPSPTAVAAGGATYGLKPVGVGPFKVETFSPGNEIVLVRNPNYRVGGLPKVDKLTYIPATDTQSRLAANISGQLDITTTQSAQDFDQAQNGGLVVLRQPVSTYTDILMNLSKPPFDDPRMRIAVAQAIDTEAINQTVYGGRHKVMKGLFAESHPYHVAVDWPPHDPEAAKKAVEELQAEGRTVDFEIAVPQPQEMQRSAQLIQQMLTDVGMAVQLKISDQPEMVTSAAAGNYTAQIRYIGILPETDNVLWQNWYSGSRGNLAKAGDPEVDRILIAARAADPADQQELYQEFQREAARWMPIVPLVQTQNAMLVGPKIGGHPGASGEGVPEEIDMREVWVK